IELTARGVVDPADPRADNDLPARRDVGGLDEPAERKGRGDLGAREPHAPTPPPPLAPRQQPHGRPFHLGHAPPTAPAPGRAPARGRMIVPSLSASEEVSFHRKIPPPPSPADP